MRRAARGRCRGARCWLAPLAGCLAAVAGGGEAGASPGACGQVTTEGCCAGERLWWCEADELRTVDCADRPACGWSERGFHDCDTAGSADPSGGHTLRCVFPDAGPPDLGVAPDGGSGCGGVDEVGCCVDEVLVYCDRGEPRAVACGLNPRCGWQASGQIYNCGTAGEGAPASSRARACGDRLPDISLPSDPASVAGDGESDAATAGDGQSADGAAVPAGGPGDDGCGCIVAGGPQAAALLVVALFGGLVMLGAERRRG